MLLMRVALIVLFSLVAVPVAKAAVKDINMEAVGGSDSDMIVPRNGSVIFRLHPNRRNLRCIGVFANAVGGTRKTFSSSIQVTFAPAAKGQSNPCTITMITKTSNHEPGSTTKTIFFRVIVPKMITRTLAHVDGAPDDRSTIGVGEQVMLTVEPHDVLADSQVTWHVSQTDSRLSNHKGLATLYAAGMGDYRRQRPGHPVHSSYDSMWMDVIPGESHAEQAAEYSMKLSTINAKLSAHHLAFADALVAIASMKTSSPTIGNQVPATQAQPKELQDEEINIVARILLASHLRIDAKFNPKNEPAYGVEPPKGSTLLPGDKVYTGSIPPEDIREPALRKQYEEAIAANDAQRAYYEQQSEATRDNERVIEYATRYLAELCEHSQQSVKAFIDALATVEIDHHVVKEVKKRIEQDSHTKQL